jgi:hypothetical protein
MSNIFPIIEQLGVVVHEIELDPQLLLNDHEHYQRYTIEAKVEAVMHKLKSGHPFPNAFAAMRQDGSYWLLDRQHHTEAAKRLGISAIPVWVFNSTGWQQEAELFERFQELQNRKGNGND